MFSKSFGLLLVQHPGNTEFTFVLGLTPTANGALAVSTALDAP
jgi:hypothetical protein